MGASIILLVALASVTGVVWGGPHPPLMALPDFDANVEAVQGPAQPYINVGLEGLVTEEDWDRATVKGVNQNITINDFMGCGRDITITGKTMKTIKKRTIYAFQGFRFGKAPEGDLRFKKTVPAGPYFDPSNDIDATYMGNKCPQMSMIGSVVGGKEDCLFLNVYTPYLPEEGKKLPVMMWIYGGAFISGDASLYMPTRLLDKDIILVVMQYRLGTLGWFSLQNENAPGNAGLWDQITALQWIQDNIAGFGGDPDRVTVAGESAGSASVNYLLLLKSHTAGLLHGVIGESGTALDHWALDPDPVTSAQLLGEKNGCTTDDLDALYECMKIADYKEMTKIIASFVSEDRKHGQMGFRGAAPVIQNEALDAALVIKHPKQYYEDEDMNDVPLFQGCNKHEGAYVFAIMYWEFLLPNHKLEDPIYLQDHMMTDLINTFGIEDPSNGIGEALKDNYVGGRDLADFENATPGLVDLAGMLFLKAGAWETAKLHANHTTSKTFVYSFDFESNDTLFKIFFGDYKNAPFKSGVCHGDELLYLYSLPANLNEQQLLVKDRLVTLWTNFVIHGDPTPDADTHSWQGLEIPKWEPVMTGDHHYMLIEGECTLLQEYPDRWHISLDDDDALHTTVPPSTTEDTQGPTVPLSTTEDTQGPTVPPSTTEDTHGPNQDDYDKINQDRTIFMGCMIAFIVTTVILGGVTGFLCFKRR